MFVNRDLLLSLLQLSEMQWETYNQFLKLTGNREDAEKQTQIFMNAMMLSSRSDTNNDKEI